MVSKIIVEMLVGGIFLSLMCEAAVRLYSIFMKE